MLDLPADAYLGHISPGRLRVKIYREVEASLTGKERKTLEMASREYQPKKMAKHE